VSPAKLAPTFPAAFPLGPRARFRVTGTDAVRYLSGQLSNRLPSPGTSNEALILTAKGKLCARILVFTQHDGSFLIDSDEAVRDPLAARLSRYIVADDVEIEDVSTPDAGWHILGWEAQGDPADWIMVSRLGEPGIDSATLPTGMPVLDAGTLNWIRICRGVPAWGSEINEDTLPHEAGLDRTAVDFHKGCYVGQEVVSRIESVGRTNRILRGLVGDFPATPANSLLDSQGNPAGKITSATRHFGLATSVALGYVNSRTTESTFAVTDEAGLTIGQCQIHEFPLA
jgi:folate-binding protein YgfZ